MKVRERQAETALAKMVRIRKMQTGTPLTERMQTKVMRLG
jgi:hypothetical protein